MKTSLERSVNGWWTVVHHLPMEIEDDVEVIHDEAPTGPEAKAVAMDWWRSQWQAIDEENFYDLILPNDGAYVEEVITTRPLGLIPIPVGVMVGTLPDARTLGAQEAKKFIVKIIAEIESL